MPKILIKSRPATSEGDPEFRLRSLACALKKRGCLRRRMLFETCLMLLSRPGDCVRLRIADLDEQAALVRERDTLIPVSSAARMLLGEAFRRFGNPEKGWIFAGIRQPAEHLSAQVLNRALRDLTGPGSCADSLRFAAARVIASRELVEGIPAGISERGLLLIFRHSRGIMERWQERVKDLFES